MPRVAAVRLLPCRQSAATWGVGITAAVLLLPSLLYPFGRDQGVFVDVAQVLLRGGLPYRDVWDIKPPGIYALYAAIVGLFGSGSTALRVTDLVVQVTTAVALYLLGRPLLGPMPAALGALWYAALYLRCGYWGMAQAEGFANLPTLLALFLWMAGWRARHPLWMLGAGMLAGTASLLKFPAALACAAAPAWALVIELRGPRQWWRLLQGVIVLAAGVALPVLAAALLLRALGAWDAYLEIQRGFVAPYAQIAYSGTSWWARGGSGTRAFVTANGLPCGLAAIGAVAVARAAAPPERSVLFGWLTLTIAAVWSQGKYFQYHWIPVLMPLSLLAGAGLWGVAGLLLDSLAWARSRVAGESRGRLTPPPNPLPEAERGSLSSGPPLGWHWRSSPRGLPHRTQVTPLRFRGQAPSAGEATPGAGEGLTKSQETLAHRITPTLVCLAVILAWSVAGQWPSYRDGWRVLTGALPLRRYQERFGPPFEGDYSYVADVWAAEYARATTGPGDAIFIWGFEPLVYVLSGRRPPTRFHFAVPLVSPWAPPAWRRELMRDLQARPPELFLVLEHDAIPWASGRRDDSRHQLTQFEELHTFLQRDYRFERQLEHFAIFRLRKRPAHVGRF